MDQLDGDVVQVVLVVKESGKERAERLTPVIRPLAEAQLANARNAPWFVSGRIESPEAAERKP